MDPNNNDELKTFNWTDQNVVTLCEFLNNYLMKNGRSTPFRWSKLQPEFENLVDYKFNSDKALKNKYDGIKQDYNLWKSLKNGETGLGWNEATKTLDCSNEWWEKKIKEKPDVKRIRKKQPSKDLQEAWDKLFGGMVATGAECVAPSIDSSTLKEVPRINLEEEDIGGDDEDAYDVYTQYSSQLKNLETGEKGCFRGFINAVQPEDGSQLNQVGGSKQYRTPAEKNTKPKPVKMKRKGRESSGASMFKEYMTRQDDAQERCLKILESDTPNTNEDGTKRLTMAINVIHGMVDEGLMIEGSDLWCFAMTSLEDAVKREVFLNLRDDGGRLAWLEYSQKHAN